MTPWTHCSSMIEITTAHYQKIRHKWISHECMFQVPFWWRCCLCTLYTWYIQLTSVISNQNHFVLLWISIFVKNKLETKLFTWIISQIERVWDSRCYTVSSQNAWKCKNAWNTNHILKTANEDAERKYQSKM